MSDVENTHICSSKMVFEVCKGYMLMLLIKGKNHIEMYHFCNACTTMGL